MTDRAPRRVFVTVGTHEDPFDRLVSAAVRLADEGYDVRIQAGSSAVPTPGCEAAASFPPERMVESFEWADLVVAHGGPSTLIEAAGRGHVPILVPRRAHRGEHVDDHQLWFARRVSDRVHVVEDPADLLHAVQTHHAHIDGLLPFGPDAERTRAFAASLEEVCLGLVRGTRARGGRRGRLAALRRWMRRTP